MATSNNDRISSAKLATFATKLWTKIKDTFAKKDDLADVATSGNYGDLANIPVESLFYAYYGTTTATEVQTAVSNKKIPVLVMSATDNTVKGYYCGSRNGNFYFESADNPPDPRDDQDIKEKTWFYVYGDTWATKTVTLYAEKADGIVDNSDDERVCKAQYWGDGCSISSISPTGTNQKSGTKYVAGFYNDGNGGVLAPCNVENVTVNRATRADNEYWSMWNADDSGFDLSNDVMSRYSNILLYKTDTTPAGTFTIYSSQLPYAKHYKFNFPLGGTLRFRNNSGHNIYPRRNGKDGVISNGGYRDVTVSSGGIIECCFNGDNAVFFSVHNPGSNAGTGGIFQPIYINGDGVPTACNFKIV